MTSIPRRGVRTTAVAALALALTACTSDELVRRELGVVGPQPVRRAASSAAPAATVPFGPGCAAVPAAGSGQLRGPGARPGGDRGQRHVPALSGLVQP